MGRLTLFGLMLLLVSCGSNPIKVKCEAKETFVPILYSPAPPTIKRPDLPIHRITNEQLKNDGIVAKYYKATIKTLIGYSKEMEKALAEYDKINKAYKAEEDKIRTKFGDIPKELSKE